MVKFEKTYLVKFLPENLGEFASNEIADIYIPEFSFHPKLRIRKNGGNFEISKKELIVEDKKSYHQEQTIFLTEIEYNELAKLAGKKVRKLRIEYPYDVANELRADIDIFQDSLFGLVVASFDFNSEEQRTSFVMPDFCLADISSEDFIAGGIICGKTYKDIEKDLEKYNYKKILS